MSPKVLLCTPKHLEHPVYTVIPNISLSYLAAAVKDQGFPVEVLDCQKDNLSPSQCAAYAEETGADVIGFTLFSSFVSSTRAYLAALRSRLPRALLVVGGVHVIFEPKATLRDLPAADFGFCGESDESFPLFLKKHFNGGYDPSDIPNLVYREGNTVLTTPQTVLEDLSLNPLPAWDLIRPYTYPPAPNGIFSKATKIAPIIATRGCPYPCTFCGAGKASGKPIRKRPLSDILTEIRWLQDMGIREIHLMDDNFTFDLDFAKSFCQSLLKENIFIHWALPNGVRIDRLDAELLTLMEASGCYSMAVGIESGTDRGLKRISKHLTISRVQEQLQLIKKTTGIRVTGFFIIGYPGENRQEIEETIRFARHLPLDRANFFNFTPFPGSPIYYNLKAKGELENLPLEKLYIHSIVYSNPLEKRELAHLQRKAHLRFYLRARILKGILREIRSFFQIQILALRILAILFPKTRP